MANFTYDGSFPGLLCTLRAAWQQRTEVVSIGPETGAQAGLFGDNIFVDTDAETATDVWQNLLRWMTAAARDRLYYVFLTEVADAGLLIYRYVAEAIRQRGADLSEQYANDTVRRVLELARRVHREEHRMRAFVRFSEAADGRYHATIEPVVNVLPLLGDFFARRFADQQWLIYDARRHFGLAYDGHRVRTVRPESRTAAGRTPAFSAFTQEEPQLQQLWQTYFDHATIAARRSPERHRRHLPRRYWKLLPEKQPRPAPPESKTPVRERGTGVENTTEQADVTKLTSTASVPHRPRALRHWKK